MASLLVLEHYHNQTEISKKLWREIFSAIWTLNLLVTGSYDLYSLYTTTLPVLAFEEKNKRIKIWNIARRTVYRSESSKRNNLKQLKSVAEVLKL